MILTLHGFRKATAVKGSEEESLLNECIKLSVLAHALAADDDKKKKILSALVPCVVGLLRSTVYETSSSSSPPNEESQHNLAIQLLISFANKHTNHFKDILSLLAKEDRNSFEKSVKKMQLMEQQKAKELEEKKKKAAAKKEPIQKLDFSKYQG